MAMKSTSEWHFGEDDFPAVVQVLTHPSQLRTDSQQHLTTTGGLFVSLHITPSKHSRNSLMREFCTT